VQLTSESSGIDRELSLSHRSNQISPRNTSTNSAHAVGYLQWPPIVRRHVVIQHRALLNHSEAYFQPLSSSNTCISSVAETVAVLFDFIEHFLRLDARVVFCV
jgi:hypothetical protein